MTTPRTAANPPVRTIDRSVIGRADLIADVTGLVVEQHQVVALTGEPGVGKTTVWAEILVGIEAAWTWSAQCLEAEAELGHAVLADFFLAVPDPVVAALPAPQRRAVDIVLFREEGDPTAPVDDRLLGATTVSLLTLLAQQGRVAIGIDDAQWCDPTSLLALDSAVHRVKASGVAVVTSARPGSSRGLSDAVTIPVPRLPLDSTRALVQQVTGLSSNDDRVAHIAQLSGGNPFFARELAHQQTQVHQSGPGDLPRSISSLLQRRLLGVDGVTRSLLLDVAVRGWGRRDEFDPDAVGRAVRADLLVPEINRLRFSHPLLSAAVLEAATGDDIRAAHGRAARSTHDPIAGALHRARSSGPSAEVADELDAAVALARDRGDLHGALALAEHALRLTPGGERPPQRVMAVANLDYALGRLARAGELAQEVLPVADSPLLRASALMCIAFSLSDGVAKVEMLQEAASLNALPMSVYAKAVVHTAFAMQDNGRLLEAIELVDTAVDVAADPATECSGLVATASYLKRYAGIHDDGSLLTHAVEAERRRNASPEGINQSSHEAIGCAAMLAVLDDRHKDAAALLREAAMVAARRGELNPSAYYPGLLALRTGHPRRALQIFTAAGDADGPNPLVHARIALAVIWLGEFDRVDDEVARAQALLYSESDARSRGEIYYAVGLQLALTGRAAEAWPDLRATTDAMDSMSYREPSQPAILPLAIEAACAAGDLAASRELCQRLQRDSAAVGSRFGAAAVSCARGYISQAERDDDAADVHFTSAVRAFKQLHVPLEAGRCLVSLGALLRRTGHRSKARAALSEARTLVADSGARGLLDVIEAEEGRISGRSAASPKELTPSELKVAELAAEGMRNGEISRTLHLSIKTVETHLGKAYRKLEISNRTQLARALDRRLGG